MIRSDFSHLFDEDVAGPPTQGSSARGGRDNAARKDGGKGVGEATQTAWSIEVDGADAIAMDVPPRRWLVHERVPMGEVTLLTGDGSAGKTTIAMQLAVSVIAGLTDWLGGVIDEPGGVFFLTAEESMQELIRRLQSIALHYRVTDADMLAGLSLRSERGADPAFATIGRGGVLEPTAGFRRVVTDARTRRPTLIVAETIADLFAADEVKRAHVRAFMRLMRSLADECSAAVLLLGHPSLAGMSSGSGLAGSTDWNNGPRARLYLRTPRQNGSGEPIETELRELVVMKSNYGRAGEIVPVVWRDGVYVVPPSLSTIERAAAEQKIDDLYMRLLAIVIAQGRHVSPNQSIAYAPSVFGKMPDADHTTSAAFAAAQERLLASGRIKVKATGPPSRSRQTIVAS
jgi:RecA-family ATPase